MKKSSKKEIEDYIFFHLNVKGNTNKELILNFFVEFSQSKPNGYDVESMELFLKNTDFLAIDKEPNRIIQHGIIFGLLKKDDKQSKKNLFAQNWFSLISKEIIFIMNREWS